MGMVSHMHDTVLRCEAPVETKFRPGAVISSASQHEFDETIHFFRVEKERAARNEPLPRRQTGIILSAVITMATMTITQMIILFILYNLF